VRIQDVHLQQGVRDSIAWRWPRTGCIPPVQHIGFNSKASSVYSEII
jgi:hypothetical protein